MELMCSPISDDHVLASKRIETDLRQRHCLVIKSHRDVLFSARNIIDVTDAKVTDKMLKAGVSH